MNEVLTDEDVLRFTQGTRRKFVDFLLQDGFPVDPKSQYVLLTSLADMDRTALGSMRVGAQKKMAESDQMVADALVSLRAHLRGSDPMKTLTPSGAIPSVQISRLPAPVLVPGESEIGLAHTNYDEFIDKIESNIQPNVSSL